MLTNGIMKALSFALILTLAASLAACSGAARKSDSYTSSSGSVLMLDTDRQACERSCNSDYDRCGDSRAAQQSVGRGQMTGIFGGEADCKASLRSCLSQCKSR